MGWGKRIQSLKLPHHVVRNEVEGSRPCRRRRPDRTASRRCSAWRRPPAGNRCRWWPAARCSGAHHRWRACGSNHAGIKGRRIWGVGAETDRAREREWEIDGCPWQVPAAEENLYVHRLLLVMSRRHGASDGGEQRWTGGLRWLRFQNICIKRGRTEERVRVGKRENSNFWGLRQQVRQIYAMSRWIGSPQRVWTGLGPIGLLMWWRSRLVNMVTHWPFGLMSQVRDSLGTMVFRFSNEN